MEGTTKYNFSSLSNSNSRLIRLRLRIPAGWSVPDWPTVS